MKTLRPKANSRQGFSLLELLVVLSIIVLLAVIALPSYRNVRARANLVTCTANLRSLYAAAQTFASDNDGTYPTNINNSWHGQLAPYLGITLDKGELPGAPPCKSNVFLCPSVYEDSAPRRSYAMNYRAGDINGYTDEKPLRIALPAQTAFISDGLNTSWLQTKERLSYRHAGVSANVLFFDGHVEALTKAEADPLPSRIFIDGQIN